MSFSWYFVYVSCKANAVYLFCNSVFLIDRDQFEGDRSKMVVAC